MDPEQTPNQPYNPTPPDQFTPSAIPAHQHPIPAHVHPEPVYAPTQNQNTPGQNYARDDQPMAVVKVLSVRGLEYFMMSLALWAGAFSFAGILLSLVNGGTNFDVLAFPVSVLIVSAGLFGFFFLRLKKAELWNPALRFDPSKRRLSQLTQIVAYIAGFVSLVGIVYSLIAKIAGSLDQTLWKLLLDFVIVLVVAGGILAYYWIDEHRG